MIHLDQLIVTLMQVVIENAGAETGTLVLLKEDQATPADLVVLLSSGKDGQFYISTADLDGATCWNVCFESNANEPTNRNNTSSSLLPSLRSSR